MAEFCHMLIVCCVKHRWYIIISLVYHNLTNSTCCVLLPFKCNSSLGDAGYNYKKNMFLICIFLWLGNHLGKPLCGLICLSSVILYMCFFFICI